MNIIPGCFMLFLIFPHCMVLQGESQSERFTPYNLVTVENSNLHRDLIEAEINRLVTSYEHNDSVEPIIHPVQEILGIHTEDLFPGFRFYVISHDEVVKEDAPYIPGLAINLYYTLAISQEEATYRFPGYGNYESFGLFLSEQRLSIQSEEDATNIWCAFCEIHLKSWAGQPFEKMSDTVWHLGLYSDEYYNYHYEVILDSEGLVISGILQATRSDI